MRAFPPEELARALHRRLVRAFWLHRPRVAVTVAGAGPHWECVATGPDRRCAATCLDNNGAEFLIEFAAAGEASAWGRTTARIDAVEAIRMWLGGAALAAVQRRFPFVDVQRRALVELQALVLADPRLAGRVAGEVVPTRPGRHELRLAADDGAIHVSFHGRNPFPDADFARDGRLIAQAMLVDPRAFVALVGAWLVDRAAPGPLQRAFPWLVVLPGP